VATLGSVVETKSVAKGEETHSSGSGGIPNISPGSTSTRLDNTDAFPFLEGQYQRMLERPWPFVSTWIASTCDNSLFFMGMMNTAMMYSLQFKMRPDYLGFQYLKYPTMMV
jgi:hypothetical protein